MCQNVTHLVSLVWSAVFVPTIVKNVPECDHAFSSECDPSCFISLECRIRPNYSKKMCQNVTMRSHQNVTHLVSLVWSAVFVPTIVKNVPECDHAFSSECDPSCFISLECSIRPIYGKRCARM